VIQTFIGYSAKRVHVGLRTLMWGDYNYRPMRVNIYDVSLNYETRRIN